MTTRRGRGAATEHRTLTFTAIGDPVPQGSMRWLGNRGMIATNKTRLDPWRETIRTAAHHAMPEHWQPLDGPLTLDVWFTIRRPRSHHGTGRNTHTLRDAAPRYPAGRPDLDKLIRAVMDAMTSIGCWLDDAQVVRILAAKVYDNDGPPRVTVTVRTIDDAHMRAPDDYPELVAVTAHVCRACLNSEGSECHTPGCIYWMCDVPTPNEVAAKFTEQP